MSTTGQTSEIPPAVVGALAAAAERRIVGAVALLLAALLAPPAAARPTGSALVGPATDAPTVDDLIRIRLIEESFRETIGVKSWREHQRAAFDLHLEALDGRLDRGWRHPRRDRAEAIMADSALKFLRKRAEAQFGIDALERRWRERRSARRTDRAADDRPPCSLCQSPSLRLSPRVDVGDHPFLGLKMSLRGVSPLLTRFDLRIDERFDEGVRAALSYEWRETWVELEYRSDDRHRGELLELQLRLAF